MNLLPAYGIQSLIHAYDGKIALNILRFEIASGRIYAFVGPNGCGKTTLLSILSLLLVPSSGSVLMYGVETVHSRNRDLRRKVTLVHQKPVMFSTSVRNNIAYGLHALGLRSKEIRDRIQPICEEMKLTDLADKPARKLSGGEVQRVVLARALVLETPILLLDEPTNSLDEASKSTLRDLLIRASEMRETTIVLATHSTDFVESLTEHVVRMESGRILEA